MFYIFCNDFKEKLQPKLRRLIFSENKRLLEVIIVFVIVLLYWHFYKIINAFLLKYLNWVLGILIISSICFILLIIKNIERIKNKRNLNTSNYLNNLINILREKGYDNKNSIVWLINECENYIKDNSIKNKAIEIWIYISPFLSLLMSFLLNNNNRLYFDDRQFITIIMIILLVPVVFMIIHFANVISRYVNNNDSEFYLHLARNLRFIQFNYTFDSNGVLLQEQIKPDSTKTDKTNADKQRRTTRN